MCFTHLLSVRSLSCRIFAAYVYHQECSGLLSECSNVPESMHVCVFQRNKGNMCICARFYSAWYSTLTSIPACFLLTVCMTNNEAGPSDDDLMRPMIQWPKSTLGGKKMLDIWTPLRIYARAISQWCSLMLPSIHTHIKP